MIDEEESVNKTVQEILLELSEPILFKNILSSSKDSNDWKILEWSLEDLADKFGDLKLPFRVGKNSTTDHPQWENETPIECKTLRDFLADSSQSTDPTQWYYFDYKHMNDWFKDMPEIMESFNWDKFESSMNTSDSTIWIGSKGAHTNCHQDTYGCNLVAQTHGRKLWLLAKPECSSFMHPTRIPYEESTIFSKHNFFTPGQKEIKAIESMSDNTRMIILEPRDVLFIPKGWWHYVESLETSMSVNVWLPMKEDCYSRFREALVHLIMNIFGDEISRTEDQPKMTTLKCIEFIEASFKECQRFNQNAEPPQKKRKLDFSDLNPLNCLKIKFPNVIQPIPCLNTENMNNFLNKNAIRSVNIEEESPDEVELPSKLSLLEKVLDAYCDPSVVSKVTQILMNT